VFRVRGTTVEPTIVHSVPSDMITCGPRWLEATTDGVSKANEALKGIGGNALFPVTAPLVKSTTLRYSLPLLAAYRVLVSPPNAIDRGSWPTGMGGQQLLLLHVEDLNPVLPGLAM